MGTMMKQIVPGMAAILLAMSSAAALADGMPSRSKGSTKDVAAEPAVDEGRKFGFSWNFGGTTDYIFRGISQNGRQATPQGGVDFTYGILYAGIWSSGIDFGNNPFNRSFPNSGRSVAGTEIDFYAGIKPVYGPVTFDLGVIYYAYPAANDHGPKVRQSRELDYVEAKLGATVSPMTNLTTGVTVYLSPQYTGGQGATQVVEGTLAYQLPNWGKVVPTVGGTLGGVFGDARDVKDPFVAGNGRDSYLYWNAGLTLGLDKLSLDFRYWDTDIRDRAPGGPAGFCHGNGAANGTSGGVFQCDSRFVFTAKVTF